MQGSGTTDSNNIAAPEQKYSLATRLSYHTRSGLFFYWSSFFILIFIEFFLGGTLSKMLAKNNYSLYVNVLNNLPFYNVLVNIGISYGIVYMVSYNKHIRYSLFRQTMLLQFFWYLIVAVVHIGLFMMFRNFYFEGLCVAALISYAYTYRLNMTSFFVATHRYNKAAVSNIAQKTFLLIAFIYIHNSGWLEQSLNKRFVKMYPAIELSMVAVYFIGFAGLNLRAFAAPKVNYAKRVLRYGKYALVNNGLNVLYYTILALIIRASNIGLHQQIILGLCIMFFRYTAVAISPILSTMSPQLTLRKNERWKVRQLYKKYLTITLIVSLGTLLGCRLLFSYVIDYFYNISYQDLPPYFYFFCYLIPLLFLNSLNGSVMAALGKIKFTTVAEVVCTILLIVFLVYDLVAPIGNYDLFYYMVLIHLIVKFIMLSAGTYKALN